MIIKVNHIINSIYYFTSQPCESYYISMKKNNKEKDWYWDWHLWFSFFFFCLSLSYDFKRCQLMNSNRFMWSIVDCRRSYKLDEKSANKTEHNWKSVQFTHFLDWTLLGGSICRCLFSFILLNHNTITHTRTHKTQHNPTAEPTRRAGTRVEGLKENK
jgi:hypothetical protein